jgi:hypothetical protein
MNYILLMIGAEFAFCEMDSSQRYHLCSDNAGKTTNKTPNAIK